MNTPTAGNIRPKSVLPIDRAAQLETYYDRARGALASLHFELSLLGFEFPDLADRLGELKAPIREAFAATSRVETALYRLIRGE